MSEYAAPQSESEVPQAEVEETIASAPAGLQGWLVRQTGASAIPRAPQDPRTLIALQQLVGNAAIARLIAGSPATLGSPLQRQKQPASPPQPSAESESTDEGPFRVFDYEGQTYVMTLPEFDEFCGQLNQKVRANEFTTLMNAAQVLADNVIALMQLNEEHLVISWVCETLGGAELDPGLMEPVWEMLDSCNAALQGTDVNGARDALALAEQALKEAALRYDEYTESLQFGGKITITALDITATTAFAILSVAGGAVLAPTLGAVGGSAVAGGGSALLQSYATHVGGAWSYGDERLDEAAVQVLIDGAVGAASAGLAARVLPGVTQKLSGQIYAKLAPKLSTDALAKLGGKEGLMLMINNASQGGLGNAIQGAFVDIKGLVTRNTTITEFIEHIVVNLIAGGITGGILAKMNLKVAGVDEKKLAELQRELDAGQFPSSAPAQPAGPRPPPPTIDVPPATAPGRPPPPTIEPPGMVPPPKVKPGSD